MVFNGYLLHTHTHTHTHSFPGSCSGKESASQCRRCKRYGFHPWDEKTAWRRKWQPTTVFLSGKSHGQRSLVGNSPWGRKELDMAAHRAHPHIFKQSYVVIYLDFSRVLHNEVTLIKHPFFLWYWNSFYKFKIWILQQIRRYQWCWLSVGISQEYFHCLLINLLLLLVYSNWLIICLCPALDSKLLESKNYFFFF